MIYDNLIRLFGNDMTLVGRFIEKVKEELPKDLAALKTALSRKNESEIRLLAHGIKSQLRYFNADELADEAEFIEHAKALFDHPVRERIIRFADQINVWVSKLEVPEKVL
jgi:HPt (histidine-containing phosphotransfer) domain-containing protein